MTKDVVGTIGGVLIVDYPFPVHELLKSKGKLFDLLIYFVKTRCIIEEIELIGTDSGSGGDKSSNSEGLHPKVIRLNFINY